MISRDHLLRRQQRQSLLSYDGRSQLQVSVHARHLIALVDILESLEQGRLVVAILRREEELILAVVELRPDVQRLCLAAAEFGIHLFNIGRYYAVVANRQVDTLLIVGEPNHAQVRDNHAAEVTIVSFGVLYVIHTIDYLFIFDQA